MFEEKSYQKSILSTSENQVDKLEKGEEDTQNVLRRFGVVFEKKDISPLLEKAINIALNAHAGQKDKAGEPYISHPFRLMSQMETEEERIVAILHDVIEDSDVNLDALRADGFSQQIIESVDILTRKDSDTYEEFIEKIRPFPLARRVKLADLRDNLRIDRIPHPTEKDFVRIEKYKKAVGVLGSE